MLGKYIPEMLYGFPFSTVHVKNIYLKLLSNTTKDIFHNLFEIDFIKKKKKEIDFISIHVFTKMLSSAVIM